MVKRILIIAFCINIIFAFNVWAETTAPDPSLNEQGVQTENQMPQGRGARGGMGGPRGGRMPQGGMGENGEFVPPERPQNENGEFTPPERPQNENGGNFTPPDASQGENPGGQSGTPSENNNTPAETDGNESGADFAPPDFHQGGFMPNAEFSADNTGISAASGGISGFLKKYSTPVISFILLGAAFVFVIFYKRKNY